jgi:hypothetical protein
LDDGAGLNDVISGVRRRWWQFRRRKRGALAWRYSYHSGIIEPRTDADRDGDVY